MPSPRIPGEPLKRYILLVQGNYMGQQTWSDDDDLDVITNYAEIYLDGLDWHVLDRNTGDVVLSGPSSTTRSVETS